MKANWFVRTCIIFLCLLITSVVVSSFYFFESKGTISGGLITLIAILVVLVLSESFDNFSIYNVMSLNREIKKQSAQNETLRNENNELRNQVIKVATSVSQTQSNSTYFGLTQDMIRQAFVEQASDDEIEESDDRQDKDDTACDVRTVKKLDHKAAANLVLSKYCENIGIAESAVIKQAKLVSIFNGVDPVSDKQPIYDGYVKALGSEIFIEAKNASSSPYVISDRLYYMLNKIYFYNRVSGAKAFLVLLVYEIDAEVMEVKDRGKLVEVITRHYAPAIQSGLLKVVPVPFSKEESGTLVTEKPC